MTIQEQADAILAGWNHHRDAQDELMARLAQDRDALLKALKSLLAFSQDPVWSGDSAAWDDAAAAITQAERPR